MLIPEETPQVELSPSRRRRSTPRVVCLGGGTGLSMILRGLKRAAAVTAVVTTTDDGGSSGRLRRDFGMPAPGDVRHCLSALAEDESLVGTLFEHRFATGELSGHTFGNLFLAGLTDLLGSFDQAVSESARVLAVAGRVVPSTTDMVELVAEVRTGAPCAARRRSPPTARRSSACTSIRRIRGRTRARSPPSSAPT